MKKKRIVGILCLWVLLIWSILGDIKIQLGDKYTQFPKHTVTQNLENISHITGIFFRSPGDSLATELQYFNKSTNIIDLRTYECTQKDFISLFQKLANSWVQVRIIVENNKFKQYQNTLKVLQQKFSGYQNIQLKSDQQMWTTYTHAKVNLIDSGVIIQTANLTKSSFASNREHFFASYDTWIWTSLHTIFQKDWDGIKITPKDIHPNLVVCNINCRGVIEQLLASAKNSIIIQTQYITDDAIREILKAKKNLNEYKFLVADTDDNTELVRYFGPQNAKKFTKWYNHTKMIMIDHKILLLGSMNLSATSLDENREIWILLTDPMIIHRFSEEFVQDWNSVKTK